MKRSCGSRGANTNTTNNCNKVERKTIEKNRRMHMKSLSLKLLSLIPKDHFTTSKDALTQLDHLDEAASYIEKLRGRIEKLKQRRDSGPSIKGVRKDTSEGTTTPMTTTTVGVRLPMVEVRYQDTNLEVVLISSSSSSSQKRRFRFHEVISVLEEEGAEVVNANFSVVGDKVFHTIHSQAVCSRIGLEASRVSERLKELAF